MHFDDYRSSWTACLRKFEPAPCRWVVPFSGLPKSLSCEICSHISEGRTPDFAHEELRCVCRLRSVKDPDISMVDSGWLCLGDSCFAFDIPQLSLEFAILSLALWRIKSVRTCLHGSVYLHILVMLLLYFAAVARDGLKGLRLELY